NVIGGDPAALPTRTGGRLILRSFSHEPGFSPEGKTVLQATCFLSGEEADGWFCPEAEYKIKKDAFVLAALDAVKTAFPYSSPAVIDAWTPATYERFTGADRGDYIGWLVPAGLIPPRLPERVRGIANLSIASGWCRMPGGLPTAARSGARAAADVLLSDPLPRRFSGASFPGRKKLKKSQKFDLPS
ncbi:MAG: hypothetical protein J6P88_02075, partial [Clostridia bacterium]|nr:hypothetical protein [Clostridia bacterium]